MAEGTHVPPSDDQRPDHSNIPSGDAAASKSGSRWRKRLVWGIVGFFLLLFLIVGLFGLRLLISPLSISSLTGQIEEMAADALPPGQILQLDDVQISFAQDGGLALRLTQLELRDGDELLLSAPRVDLEFGISSLFDDRIRPSAIFIPGMTARVQRDRDGRFVIAGQDPGAVGEAMGPPVRSQAVFYDPDEPEFVSFIYSMRRAIQPLADDDLSKRPPHILIRDTEIIFQDDIADKTRSFNNVAFSYNPAGTDDNLWRIDFAVDGQHGRIGFAMAEFPISQEEQGLDGRSIEFRFVDVSLADFVPRLAEEDEDRKNFEFTSPFNGAAQLAFDQKGELVDMQLALDVGSGNLDFGGKDVALLDEASFRFDWEPSIRALTLAQSGIYFGKTGGELHGVAVWPKERGGEVRIAIEGQGIKLAARDNPNPEKELQQIILQARIGRDTGIATIDRFAMIAEEGSLQGAGNIAVVDGELTSGMTFVFSEMPHDLMTQMWPVSVANGARKWIMENVVDGRTTGGTIEMALTESMLKRNEEGRMKLPDDSVDVRFGVEGLRIKGFGDLPPALGLNGTGHVTGRTFEAIIKDGYFLTKQEREYPINSGKFEIPDHSEKPATGVLVLDGSGSAAALGEILDSEPLHVLRTEDQLADDLSGQSEAKVRVQFPFIKNLKKEDVQYNAKIELHDFSSKKAIRDRLIEQADLVINTDGARVDIAGLGKIDGLSTKIDLVTSTDNSISLSSSFELELSDDDRRKLGIDLGNWLRGPVSVKVSQAGDKQNVNAVEVDLTKAVLDLNEIGWSKKANVRGKATFDLIDQGGTFAVRSVKISGDGFSATGTADISRQNGLQTLSISDLRLSRGDHLQLDVTQSRKDVYAIKLTGDVLDLRGRLLSNPLGSGTGTEGRPQGNYQLDASVKKVIGLSGHVISDFGLSIEVVNGKEKIIRARGLLDGRAELDVDTKTGQVPTVHVSSDDAGALLRFFGAVDRVLGGRLLLSVVLQNGWDDISGSVFLKDFNIGGQVEKQQSRKSSTESVNSNFNKFTTTYSGKNGVFSISNGVVKGPVLGATISGTVDMRNKNLSLSGTYIPAYGVNNFFSRLPIIGRALGNRKNEGLLGITYKIKGTMANPTVIVNPASILAPGALRKIFEFQ